MGFRSPREGALLTGWRRDFPARRLTPFRNFPAALTSGFACMLSSGRTQKQSSVVLNFTNEKSPCDAAPRQKSLGRIARTTYVDAAYCYRPSNVVCLSAIVVSPAKTAEPIEMPFGLWTRMGSSNHVLDVVVILKNRKKISILQLRRRPIDINFCIMMHIDPPKPYLQLKIIVVKNLRRQMAAILINH